MHVLQSNIAYPPSAVQNGNSVAKCTRTWLDSCLLVSNSAHTKTNSCEIEEEGSQHPQHSFTTSTNAWSITSKKLSCRAFDTSTSSFSSGSIRHINLQLQQWVWPTNVLVPNMNMINLLASCSRKTLKSNRHQWQETILPAMGEQQECTRQGFDGQKRQEQGGDQHLILVGNCQCL